MDMIEIVAGIGSGSCFILWILLLIMRIYILYKHNCVRVGEKPKCLKGFRLEVIGSLLSMSRTCARGVSGLKFGNPPSQDIRVSVSRVGLSRGRCQIYVQDRIPSKEQKHTAMACPSLVWGPDLIARGQNQES